MPYIALTFGNNTSITIQTLYIYKISGSQDIPNYSSIRYNYISVTTTTKKHWLTCDLIQNILESIKHDYGGGQRSEITFLSLYFNLLEQHLLSIMIRLPSFSRYRQQLHYIVHSTYSTYT